MKRHLSWSLAVVGILALAASLGADVKKTEKVTFKLEGMLGGIVNRMAGGAKDGIESSTALKGNRLATVTGQTGQIVDLGEEKVYNLDLRRKEYAVMTFAELRAQMERARAEAQKSMEGMKPEERPEPQQASVELEFDSKVDETGQTRTVAGHEARQVILTVTGRQKGQTLEAGGGFVMTNEIWLAAAVPALNEVAQFQLRFMKAVYGETFVADMQQMAGLMVMFPSFKTMAEKMQTAGQKLQGTPVASTMIFETVKSEAQMKEAQNQQTSAGGGLSGALARRMMGNRGTPTARTKALTMGQEMMSLATSVTDADVAIPSGFKLKK